MHPAEKQVIDEDVCLSSLGRLTDALKLREIPGCGFHRATDVCLKRRAAIKELTPVFGGNRSESAPDGERGGNHPLHGERAQVMKDLQ